MGLPVAIALATLGVVLIAVGGALLAGVSAPVVLVVLGVALVAAGLLAVDVDRKA